MTDPITDERIEELHSLSTPSTTMVFSSVRISREEIHALCDALLAARRERDATNPAAVIRGMLTDEQQACYGVEPEVPGSHVRQPAQLVMRLCAALSELEQERDEAISRLADITAGCDIQRGDQLYRQVPVVIGPGKIQTEIDLAEALRQISIVFGETSEPLTLLHRRVAALLAERDDLRDRLARNDTRVSASIVKERDEALAELEALRAFERVSRAHSHDDLAAALAHVDEVRALLARGGA